MSLGFVLGFSNKAKNPMSLELQEEDSSVEEKLITFNFKEKNTRDRNTIPRFEMVYFSLKKQTTLHVHQPIHTHKQLPSRIGL